MRVGYAQATVTQGALFAAVDEGFFARGGLDVSIQAVGGPAQVPALLAGEVQFAGMGANEVANADVGGASLAMIATAVDYPLFSLYADKKYKSVQDLAGQTIGITAAGASTDAAAHLFLRHFGLDGKVKVSPAGGTQTSILAAMGKGIVAGGILAPPSTAKAAQQGFVELINGVQLGVPMNTTGIVATRAYLKAQPDVVRRFLKAYLEAWTFCADPANEQAVVQTLAKYTKSDSQDALVGYKEMLRVWRGAKAPTVNPAAVADILELSTNPKVRAANSLQFIDNSVLQSVE